MVPWLLIDRIGDLVPALGTPTFGPQFFGLFSGALDVDECTVFAFRGRQPPAPIILEGRSEEMRRCVNNLANVYVAGAFTKDPNVPLDHVPEVPIVRAVRAADMKDLAYRAQFYDEPHLAHELVLIGRTNETLYYSSFYRRDRGAVFTKTEINVAHRLANVAIKMIHKHRDVIGANARPEPLPKATAPIPAPPNITQITPASRLKLLAHLRDVLLSEPQLLSPREAEICAGIILGHTTLGISLNCGISLNTVATHRKRAYRKLGICSQNELFSRYFRFVNEHLTTHASAA